MNDPCFDLFNKSHCLGTNHLWYGTQWGRTTVLRHRKGVGDRMEPIDNYK